MESNKSKRMIIVMSCGHCPISRLMRIKDGPFCGHQATDGMEVGDYSDSIHPDCPLREGGDTPQLLEKLEITEQLLTDAITGHDKMLELKNKLAEQNEKLLKQLRYSRSICQIYLMYRKAYLLKMCGDCKICKVIAEIEGGG